MTALARISRELAWFKTEASRAVGRVSRSRQVFRRSPGAPCARLLHASDLARLLYVPIREQPEEAPPASLSVSGQELHDVARIGRHAMFLQPSAHETDHLPMIVRQSNTFSARDLYREVLGPLRRIDEVPFGIGCGRASVASHATHPDSRVESRDFQDRIAASAITIIKTGDQGA